MRAVQPSLVATLRSAPPSRSILIASVWPFWLANMSAVLPLLVATLTSVETVAGVKHGIFKISLGLGGEPQPGLKVSMTLSGNVAVLLSNSWPLSIDLKGPITFKGRMQQGPDAAIDIDGNGKMSLKVDLKYGTNSQDAKKAPARKKAEPTKPSEPKRQPL